VTGDRDLQRGQQPLWLQPGDHVGADPRLQCLLHRPVACIHAEHHHRPGTTGRHRAQVFERVARRRFTVDDDHVGLQAQHAIVDQQCGVEHPDHKVALTRQLVVDQRDMVRAVVDE